MITKLDDLLELVKTKGKKRLVAAYANDSHTVCAVSAAVDKGIVDATLVGDIGTHIVFRGWFQIHEIIDGAVT